MNGFKNMSTANKIGTIIGLIAVVSVVAFKVWVAIDHSGSQQFNLALDSWQKAAQKNIFFDIFLFVVFLIAPFIVAFWPMITHPGKEKKLLQVGVRARARIIAVQDTGRTMNNSIYVKITVEIKPGLQTSFKTYVSRVGFPQPGDEIEIIYDPSNPKLVMAAKN